MIGRSDRHEVSFLPATIDGYVAADHLARYIVATVNLTDPEAPLMKSREGILPAYNAQAEVDMDTQLVVTQTVSTAANDHHQLAPALAELAELPEELGTVKNLVADAGYHNTANVAHCEAAGVAPPIAKTKHGTAATPKGTCSAGMKRMVTRLATKSGKALYARRKSTVETAFGVIKGVLGFRRFSSRGLAAARSEWNLVCLSYNLKILHQLPRRITPQ